MRNENQKLANDNKGLRGSLDDKIKYYETQNEQLREAHEEYFKNVQSQKAQNEELRKKIETVSMELNLKTQESMLHQDALREFQAKEEELSERFNEQTNKINELKDGTKDLKEKLEAAEKEIAEASKEKDVAIKLVKALQASLKEEEIKSQTMENAVKETTQELDTLMQTMTKKEQEFREREQSIGKKEQEMTQFVETAKHETQTMQAQMTRLH